MMASSKPKVYNQVFLDAYTKEFSFIVKSRKGQNFAFCSVCSCDIKIAHAGINDIKNHIKSKKHCDYVKVQEKSVNISTFFNRSHGDMTDVINAECLFTAFILEHNLPVAVADHAGPLFKKMFPKCDVATRYSCGRTKTAAIIGEIASEKKMSLVSLLQNTPFSISTDGSNDSDSQLYPIVVTYFSSAGDKIENSLLGVPVLSGRSTGQNIGNLILDTLESKNISIKNCISLSADNAPVMIGAKNGVAAVLKSKNEDLLVMGCLCHLIHIAAEKGAQSLPISVEEVLIDIFYYLEKSAKRKDELKELQILHDVQEHKVLKHVCTRWLSLGRSLKRMIEQWNPLLSFFKNKITGQDKFTTLNSYQIPRVAKNVSAGNKISLPKKRPSQSDEPQSKRRQKEELQVNTEKLSNSCELLKREERLFMFLSSDLNKAYCLFLDFIIPTFEEVNLILQTESPQIYRLNSLLLGLFKNILSKFVKPDFIKRSLCVMDVKYCERQNQKNDDDLMIGSASLQIVKSLKKNEKENFYSAVRKYYINCCNYIRHKFPVNSNTLKHAEVSNIDKLSEKSFSDIEFFINKFPVMLQREEGENEHEAIDKLQSEFCSLQCEELPEDVVKEERMDRKWCILSKMKSIEGTLKYNRISKVMLCILTIPHSNAECERIFSSVRKTRTEFRSSILDKNLEDILIAKTMMREQCFEQTFDKEFLTKAKSATYNHLKLK